MKETFVSFLSGRISELSSAAWTLIRKVCRSGKYRRECAVSLRERLVENRIPVLVCFILASATYSCIHQRPTTEFKRPVAVKVRNAPDGMQVGVEPPTVLVTFKGTRQDMLGLDMEPPSAVYVDYPQTRKRADKGERREDGGELGVNEIPVKLKNGNVQFRGIRGFASVVVEDIKPREVKLVEDVLVDWPFEIEKPKLEGVPYNGYEAQIVEFFPTNKLVRGGSRKLEGWKKLRLKLQSTPVSVEGLAGEITREADILLPKGEDGMGIDLHDTKIKVKVKIVKPTTSIILDQIPIRLSLPQGYSLPENVSLEPQDAKATLIGVEEQLKNVASGDVAIYAEVPDGAPHPSPGKPVTVTLVARVPQDKSISEIYISPAEANLVRKATAEEPAAEDASAAGETASGAAAADTSEKSPEEAIAAQSGSQEEPPGADKGIEIVDESQNMQEEQTESTNADN